MGSYFKRDYSKWDHNPYKWATLLRTRRGPTLYSNQKGTLKTTTNLDITGFSRRLEDGEIHWNPIFFHRELQDFAMWMFTYRASNDWIPPVLSLFKLQYFLLLYPILPTHFSWRHEIPNVRKARRLSATVPGGVQLSPWLESCFKSTYSDQTPPVFSEFPLNFSGDLSVFYAETILV